MIGSRARLLCKVLAQTTAQELPACRPARPRGEADPPPAQRRAVEIRKALEQLGPLYIKVGQILSTRQDLIPQTLAAELEGLHDQVTVQPFTEMEAVLEGDLGSAWAGRFRDFNMRAPLGAASLAQAYEAVLTTGERVVVKIQRPGVNEIISHDMRLLKMAARFGARRAPLFNMTIDVEAMLGVVFDAMRPECDFTLEAANMDFARRSAARFDNLSVPEVLHATPRVLIQSMAPGTSIRDADPSAFKPEEREAIGTNLLAFMYHEYFTDRRFHADPHPGNVFVCPGGPTTLIDWGMVGHIDRRVSMSVVLILLGLARNDGSAVAGGWLEMGRPTPWADVSGFGQDMASLVPKIHASSLETLNFGASLGNVLQCSTKRGIQTNPMISVLAKSFSNIEGSARYLAPELSVTDIFTQNMRGILFAYAKEAVSEEQIATQLMQVIAASGSVPGELRGIARALSQGDLRIQVGEGQGRTSLVEIRKDARTRHVARTLLAAGALAWWTNSRSRRRD
ncbi:ABC1 kinase family protein [Streptomyces iconiensis]|uniref:AarF/UbiB family protein n=1 Tax=Streptomyces iconiensis TaxID=1384038 RepID=A0ABT6ZN69_9ACTN|nr:AarF/UbiB family protein [Streptomyces iconiensis]MDJ1130485.1 AarF/UbiB family protein [Streptomyces iconiensis]